MQVSSFLLFPGIVNMLIHTPCPDFCLSSHTQSSCHYPFPFLSSFNLSGRSFQDGSNSFLPGLCSVQWPQGSCSGSGCSSCPLSVVRLWGSLPGGPKAHPDPKGISPRKYAVLLTVLLQTSARRTQKSFRHHFSYCGLVFFTPPFLPFILFSLLLSLPPFSSS